MRIRLTALALALLGLASLSACGGDDTASQLEKKLTCSWHSDDWRRDC